MKLKRLSALVLCSAMIVSVFTGCTNTSSGSGSSATTNNTQPSTTQPSTTQPSTTQTTTPSSTTETAATDEILRGGTLVVATSSEPGTFNPVWKTDDPASIYNQNVYNKLITLNNNYEICPDLAKEWEISEDGLTYTFYLHDNVTWHDGVKFTSADVKFTIESVLEFGGRMKSEWGAIETIECPDDYTVVLHLSRSDAALLGFLAWYANQIIPKHIYEGTDWETNPNNWAPIGTGPFKFVNWTPGVSLEFEKNTEYFKGEPYVDRLVFQIIPDVATAQQALLNGEIDFMNLTPAYSDVPSLQQNPDLTVDVRTIPSRYYMGFNFGREITSNVLVREAIATALNKDEIFQRAFNGFGSAAEGYYTPVMDWAYNDVDLSPTYNPERARELLEEAGYPIAYNGFRMTLDLVVFSGQAVTDMCAIVKEQLKDVGIDVNVIQLESAAWTPRIRQDMDFDFTISNGFHGPDPHNLYGRFATNGSGKICGPFSDPELDEILLKAVEESDIVKRGDLYKEAQKRLHDNQVMVPLIDLDTIGVWRSYLDGVPKSEEGVNAGLTFSSFALTRFNDPALVK